MGVDTKGKSQLAIAGRDMAERLTLGLSTEKGSNLVWNESAISYKSDAHHVSDSSL